MEKAQEILKHIDELYCLKVDLQKIENMPETNPTQYQAWVDAFKDYDLSDVLQAIDNYWEFKNSKTKPNVAQIKATLEQHKVNKLSQEVIQVPQAKCIDFAWERMNADIEAGSCRNNLYVYRDAERIVLEDWLMRELPIEVWRKMSYASRVKVATEKGLFGDFDEALRMAAQKRFNRDYEYPSANDLENLRQQKSKNSSGNGAVNSVQKTVNYLASHWSA